jgi:hypothetical protein
VKLVYENDVLIVFFEFRHNFFQAFSNCPRYFVPATIKDKSSDKMRLFSRTTARFSRKCAAPSPQRLPFCRRPLRRLKRDCFSSAAQNFNDALDFALASDERVEFSVRLRPPSNLW